MSYVFDLLETHCSTQYLGQPIQWSSPEQLSPLKAVRAYRHVSGHWHFVSCGLRDLGKDFELSVRIAGAETPPPQWPIALLKQLASYARQSKLDSGHKISGVGPLVPSLRGSSGFACLALILDAVSNSMEVPTEEFRILQAVGLTTDEYEACVSWETLMVLNLWKKSNHLLLCSFERPSFLTDPAVKKAVQAGIASEGSSQLTTMTVVCETRRGPDALMLSLDSSAIGHLKSLVSGRLSHGRSFKFQSSDGTVTFRPSKTQANQVKYLEGGKLEIELSLQAAQAVCRRVSPKPYQLFDLPELNHLKIQVEPLEADARRVAVLSQAEWEQQNYGQGGFDQPDESDAALTIQAWKVLESELKGHLPHIYEQLDQGASDEDLTRLEQQLGFPIPEDLKAFFRRHNGFKNPISSLPDGAPNCELGSRVMSRMNSYPFVGRSRSFPGWSRCSNESKSGANFPKQWVRKAEQGEESPSDRVDS